MKLRKKEPEASKLQVQYTRSQIPNLIEEKKREAGKGENKEKTWRRGAGDVKIPGHENQTPWTPVAVLDCLPI